MKRILILGAGEMQVPIIKKSIELGNFTIVADFDANAPGLLYATERILVSTIDLEKVLAVAVEKKVDGILTTSDYPVNIVARVANELSLSAMSISVAQICTNKFLQRDFFNTNGIKTPQFQLVSDPKNLEYISHFPSVVKPVDSSASRGVKKVRDFHELQEQFEVAKQFSRNGKVIVEDYIEGREFSVETFTQHHRTTVVAITEKLTKGEELGFFVEDTHIVPARISDKEYELIAGEVLNVIELLGINNCPSHAEVKVNDKGAYMIEIACRLGGDYITSDLVPLAMGVDMLANLIQVSLGNEINVKAKYRKYSAVQFLNNVNYQKCLDFINTKSEFIIRSEVKPFHAGKITNSMERMGYIIIKANTLGELNKVLEKLN